MDRQHPRRSETELRHLQKGQWQGKQLVPETWVRAATGFQTSNGSSPQSDWDQGYGYQFWRCRHGAYRGDGAFGQYCLVLPQQDAVIAITAGVRDMQAVLNLVWAKLLPGMAAAALPADEPAREKLERTLKSLSLRPQEGTASPAKIFGRKYQFAANARKLETLMLESPQPDSTTLVVRFNGVEGRIPCGHPHSAQDRFRNRVRCGFAPFTGRHFRNCPREASIGESGI